MTREQWLEVAANAMKDGMFKRIGETVPAVRVSVGFPGGGSARKRIGEHWHPKATSDGISQIFISPILDNPIEALDTLAHELIHACYPDAGHKGNFKRVAKAIGMTGPMKSTVAGPELKSELEALLKVIGPYPHAKVNLSDRKKQSTRLLKAYCPATEYTVRVTRKWLDEFGPPICPCCREEMSA